MPGVFIVLIVEDEFLSAKSLQIDLENLGVDVLDPVAKGEIAVKVALQKKPSLILMDIRLAGGLDGIEAAAEILKIKKVPIVFMTGYATEYLKESALKLNALDYIEKPIDMLKVKKIIDTLKKNE